MSKNTQTTVASAAKPAGMTTKTLVYCALLAALGVVLSRLFGMMPSEYSRFSIEAVPTVIAGILFGPVAGGLVGFTADLVGCLFSGYAYNPIFCIPPILYGVCGGLFQGYLVKKMSIPRLFVTILPAVTLGSLLWQSFALTYIYFKDSPFLDRFLLFLGSRSIQFAVTIVLDVLIIYFLFKSKLFQHVGVWPPKEKTKKNQKEA